MVAVIRRGLFWRVYLTLLASLVLVAVLATMLWHALAEQPMRRAMNVPGAALGALMPDAAAPRPQIEAALSRVSAAVSGRVVLTDRAGRPIAAARKGRILPAGDAAAPTPHPGVGMMRGWRFRLPDGRGLSVDAAAGVGGGGPHILGLLMAIAAAVGLAAYPVVSRLTARLERLRSSLEAWGEGRLEGRAKVEGADEIAAVAASFNAAADKVETLLAAHRALLVHASHELRSPLTRLRLAVDLFARAPDDELKGAIVADIAELDGLVEEILLASRLDHAPHLLERERVDCLALAVEEGARAGASVSFEGAASDFEIWGSARLLRRLIRNLVENAARHGGPPVEITLSRTGEAGDAVVIAVSDHGPGIPAAERERVFEPFYRPSGRSEGAGSWGLGLSIVRQIAQRHRGWVSCQAGAGGGASFIAVLPVGAP